MLQGQAQFLLCHQHVWRRAGSSRGISGRTWWAAMRWCRSSRPTNADNRDGRSTAMPACRCLPIPRNPGSGRIVAAHHFTDRAAGLETVFSAHLAATLLGMARDGRGIAWLPAGLAAQDLAGGALVRAGGDEWDVAVEVRLFRPTARQSAIAERFWAALDV